MAATRKRFPTESGDYNCTTEGPAQNTRSATIRTHSLTRESVDMDTAMPRVTMALVPPVLHFKYRLVIQGFADSSALTRHKACEAVMYCNIHCCPVVGVGDRGR